MSSTWVLLSAFDERARLALKTERREGDGAATERAATKWRERNDRAASREALESTDAR
jgi:hypothetical protein